MGAPPYRRPALTPGAPPLCGFRAGPGAAGCGCQAAVWGEGKGCCRCPRLTKVFSVNTAWFVWRAEPRASSPVPGPPCNTPGCDGTRPWRSRRYTHPDWLALPRTLEQPDLTKAPMPFSFLVHLQICMSSIINIQRLHYIFSSHGMVFPSLYFLH